LIVGYLNDRATTEGIQRKGSKRRCTLAGRERYMEKRWESVQEVLGVYYRQYE